MAWCQKLASYSSRKLLWQLLSFLMMIATELQFTIPAIHQAISQNHQLLNIPLALFPHRNSSKQLTWECKIRRLVNSKDYKSFQKSLIENRRRILRINQILIKSTSSRHSMLPYIAEQILFCNRSVKSLKSNARPQIKKGRRLRAVSWYLSRRLTNIREKCRIKGFNLPNVVINGNRSKMIWKRRSRTLNLLESCKGLLLSLPYARSQWSLLRKRGILRRRLKKGCLKYRS